MVKCRPLAAPTRRLIYHLNGAVLGQDIKHGDYASARHRRPVRSELGNSAGQMDG
jgi:hypothetical protein